MQPLVPTIPAETEVDRTRKISVELNLEQWPIWFPARSKKEAKPRVLTKQLITQDGKTVTAEVEIATSRKGTLTTEDQKAYYALIEHYNHAQRRDNGLVHFSLRGLARSLSKTWGQRTIDGLTNSLTRLRANTIVWRNSYQDSQANQTYKSIDFFNIITDLKIVTQQQHGHVTRAEGYFKLHDAIIANLERNHTKPVLLDVVTGFKSEVAQILYTQLDRILSKDITAYERKTKELFADLGLEGRKYNYPAGRKQLLQPAVAELQNSRLTSGHTIHSAALERTVDGKDYKLVVRRSRTRLKNDTAEPRFYEGRVEPHPQKKRAGESITEPIPTGSTETGKGIELLAYFYKVFFGTETITTQPAQKHRDLADWMIASHGEAMSRYIVDFAKAEAAKTNFNIATFGAIANYIDRAVAVYTLEQARLKHEAEAQREAARQAEIERQQKARQQRGYELFRGLPDDERNMLLAQKRAELITSDKWQNADFSNDLFKIMFEKEAEEKVRQDLLASE